MPKGQRKSIERFEDIEAWQKARELIREIYRFTSNGKFSKDHILVGQLRSAALSIGANIAEGYGRRSNREFCNFLNYAHGSAAEVQAHLYAALDLGYIHRQDFDKVYSSIEEVSRMIQGFMNYLRRRKSPSQSPTP